MATALSNTAASSAQPGERLFTVADLAAMPDELPSGPVDFELDDGRFVVMSPPGHRHGRLQVKLGSLFLAQGEEKGHGEAHTETGVVLRRNPDSVVGPDVSFIKQESLPVREAPEGYLETIPELVVEIKSKNDTMQEMAEKAEEYLAAGVQLV